MLVGEWRAALSWQHGCVPCVEPLPGIGGPVEWLRAEILAFFFFTMPRTFGMRISIPEFFDAGFLMRADGEREIVIFGAFDIHPVVCVLGCVWESSWQSSHETPSPAREL